MKFPFRNQRENNNKNKVFPFSLELEFPDRPNHTPAPTITIFYNE
jgi:hypothetical protein